MIGDAMLGGNGFMLMIVVAATVALAVLGTTLAAMNTAVRISFAMAQDKEMPSVMGALHGKHATPHMGVWLLVGVSAILGAVGVYNVTALTGITLASNIGTFILYGLICALTFVAFAGQSEFHSGKHAIVPLLGPAREPGPAGGHRRHRPRDPRGVRQRHPVRALDDRGLGRGERGLPAGEQQGPEAGAAAHGSERPFLIPRGGGQPPPLSARKR